MLYALIQTEGRLFGRGKGFRKIGHQISERVVSKRVVDDDDDVVDSAPANCADE